MPEDLGIGIVLLEGLQQVPEGTLLSLRPCVGLFAVDIKTTFVADSNGMLVVAYGVGTDQVLMTGLNNLSITGDVVVVAGMSEALGVVGNERLDRVGPVLPRRRTVNDNEINSSHNISH